MNIVCHVQGAGHNANAEAIIGRRIVKQENDQQMLVINMVVIGGFEPPTPAL
jgi:hypothetical protein